MNYLVGQFLGQVWILVNVDLGVIVVLVVFDVWCWIDQWVVVWWMGNCIVDFVFDVQFGEDWYLVYGIFQLWYDLVIVGFKQFVFGFLWIMIFLNGVWIFFFVDFDQV